MQLGLTVLLGFAVSSKAPRLRVRGQRAADWEVGQPERPVGPDAKADLLKVAGRIPGGVAV